MRQLRIRAFCFAASLATSFAAPQAIGAAASGSLRPLLVTVDDLPIAAPGKHRDPAERERITRDLLAALAKHRIQAVGLVTWQNLQSPGETRLLEQWLAAGHELGNHSYSHLDYTSTDSTKYIADIERGRDELARFLASHGKTVRFFRFPFLREGDTPAKLNAMRAYLARSSQRNLPVTIDDEDWAYEEPWIKARAAHDRAAMDSVAAVYLEQLQWETRDHESLGDDLFERPTPQILLVHANEVGAAQWDALFTWFERSGHRFATADEVLADSAFSVAHQYVGRYGCSLWHRLRDQRRRERANAAIATLLQESAAAWNRGDLDAFCADYAEDALFVAESGTTRGRAEVLARYKKKYPDRAAMGTLSFEIIEIRLTSGMEASVLGSARPAGIQGASVAARWKLAYADRAAENVSGTTLLVLRPRAGGKWEIVQDASL